MNFQEEESRSYTLKNTKHVIRTDSNREKEKIKLEKFIRREDFKIHISNAGSKYRIQLGSQFQNILDPRDQVLEHQFCFDLFVKPHEFRYESGLEFAETQFGAELLQKIKEFLKESVSNIISIAFRLLCEGKLEERTAKQYASKNIVVNLHAVFRETYKRICSHQILKNEFNLPELKAELAYEIDLIIKNILANLADNYPQAPVTGGTPRMRQVIQEINRVQNQQNDFIFANDIQMSQYIKEVKNKKKDNADEQEQTDYTQFIMAVVNKSIQVTHSNKEDCRQRTRMEIFSVFNEQLIYLAQNKQFYQIAQSTQTKEKSQSSETEALKQNIVNYFERSLEGSPDKYEKVNTKYCQSMNKLIKQEEQDEKNLLFLPNDKQECLKAGKLKNFLKIVKHQEDGVESIKKNKRYAIGKKIPSSVKPFSRQQISNKNFIAKDSSILRVLTKWAGYLQNIFVKREDEIIQRSYHFKTINNEIVTITSDIAKATLVNKLGEQYQKVRQKFKTILVSSYEFMGQFLTANEGGFASNVQRYTEVRTISSKINTVITNLMVKYTSLMIDHLLKAGRDMPTCRGKQDINLVVFRVSDIMRAKYECSQNSFISLLRTIYLLDNQPRMKDKFKLVRVKNKLDQEANNIIINYLFLGKVQCELQLSIQEPRGMEKNYYIFSHFVYQLTRGKFGAISEIASMISQLDPMITASKGMHYQEKVIKKQKLFVRRKITQLTEETQTNASLLIENIVEKIQNPQKLKKEMQRRKYDEKIHKEMFECDTCSRLILNEKKIFTINANDKKCNPCVFRINQPEQYLINEELRNSISTCLHEGSLKELKVDSNFSETTENQLVLVLNCSGEVTFYVRIQCSSEHQDFMLQLCTKRINKIYDNTYDFSKNDYIKLSKFINYNRKQGQTPSLLYIVKDIQSLSEYLFELGNISRNDVLTNIESLIDLFKEYRHEKKFIKSMKFKTQFMTVKDSKQWSILDNCLQILAHDQVNSEEDIEKLKYRKYKHIDLSHLNYLNLQGSLIKAVPSWIDKCVQLKTLILNNNKISDISQKQLPDKLVELSVNSNQLQKIDVLNCPSLNKISLEKNKITQIYLSKNHRLVKLSLKKNLLKGVNFQNLSELEVLDLSFNQFIILDLSPLLSLKELIVNNAKGNDKRLKKINISNLSNLQRLSLIGNQLTHVDIDKNKKLKYVNIRQNNMSQITVKKMPKLEELNISQNQFTEVRLAQLPNLKTVKLTANRKLVESIKFDKIENLVNFSSLESSIKKFDPFLPTSLEQLEANKESILEYDFGGMVNLKVVNVHGYVLVEHLTNFDEKKIILTNKAQKIKK